MQSELLKSLVSKRDIVLTYINIKFIQSTQFQAELENPNVHILQIDFTMSYLWVLTKCLVQLPECHAFHCRIDLQISM